MDHRRTFVVCTAMFCVSYYPAAVDAVPKPKGWIAMRPGSWVLVEVPRRCARGRRRRVEGIPVTRSAFDKREVEIELRRSYDGRLQVVVRLFTPWEEDNTRRWARDEVDELGRDIEKRFHIARCLCGHKHWRRVSRSLRPSSETLYVTLRFKGQPFDGAALRRARKIIKYVEGVVAERGGKLKVALT